MSNIQPYIIINGVNSRTISGLLITSLPPISKPQVRTQVETVDGRSGDIITPLGFAAYDKPIKIGLTRNYDIDEVIEFFNTSGTVIFSNEPTKYYRFAIYEQIDFEKLIRFKTAEVVLHVQPYKFSTTEEPLLFNDPTEISVENNGNTDARPNLLITGSGEIDVSLNGSQLLSMDLGENDQTVIIDSENMNAYGAQSAIREVVADIEPKQDLHGYDKPWVGGAGKNKLNLNVLPSSEVTYGVTVQINNGIVTLNGTVSTTEFLFPRDESSTGIPNQEIYKDLEPSTNYIFSVGNSSNNIGLQFFYRETATGSWNLSAQSWGTGILQFRTPETFAIVWIRIRYARGIVFNNLKLYPMIRLATETDTTFEPYSNICLINGFTEANIVNTQIEEIRELFTIDLSFRGRVNFNQLFTASSSGTYDSILTTFDSATGTLHSSGTTASAYYFFVTGTEHKIPITSGHKYFVHIDDTRTVRYAVYDSGTNRNIVDKIGATIINSTYNGWLSLVSMNNTVGSSVDITCKPIVIDLTQIFGTTIADYIYNLDQTQTGAGVAFFKAIYPQEYYPYNAGQDKIVGDITPVTVILGQTVYGGELNVTTGLLEVNKIIKVGFTRGNIDSSGKLYSLGAPANILTWESSQTSVPGLLTNCFETVGLEVARRLNSGQIAQFGKTLWISGYVGKEDELDAILPNLQIVYSIAEPYTVQLTPTQINNLLGLNNLSSDTGSLSVKYKSGGVIQTQTGDIVTFTVGVGDMDKGTLLNRLITGNYDKIRLKKGENVISFTGNVKQVSIDKYSRWI